MASKNSLEPSARSARSAGFESLSNDFDDIFDDTMAFVESLTSNDPLFSAGWDQDTPPYDGNLYSTPLSWDPPVPNAKEIHERKQDVKPITYGTMSALTPAQQEKLRNIAMPPHLKYRDYSPKSTPSYKSNSVSSPENNDRNNRKRKPSTEADDEDDEDSSGQHAPKKTSHNMIEKRYRTNLNDKIAALRDSVPSLRIMRKSARGEDTAEDREELQGLTPAHKLNKATVLSKATEYIAHLEKCNKRLQNENLQQKARLDAFEKLFNAGSMGINPFPQYTQPFQFPQDYQTPGPSPGIEGMIQVPEEMRRLHGHSNQQAYQVPQEQVQQTRRQTGRNGWQNGNGGGGYLNKFMIGSLAGLMILEGFSEAEKEAESPGARGLFALPTQLLKGLCQNLHSSFDFNVAGYHIPAARTFQYFRVFFLLGALLVTFLPSLFTPKPKSQGGKEQSASLATAPSLASSIQVRRQAWLTAIQTVWVPGHNFFLEAAALCLKMVKLSIRNAIGSHGYALLTGITERQEMARVKAWEIALDAQLAGGDVEVSKSRLTLTLLASGTLPDTPERLMLKALHIRVLLWEVGNAGFNGIFMFREVAAKLARWKWNEAKQLQRLVAHTEYRQEDGLPEYLVALLEEECDDVLVDCIGQRAYNLAWNLPTTHRTRGFIDGMDAVVDDFAIRSPLDAVAAWWSSLALQRALAKSLESKIFDITTQESIFGDLTLAIKTAPIGSGAQIRALVARAVLVKEKRGANIAAALKVLGPFEPRSSKGEAVPTLINTSTSMAALPDIKMALCCAMAIAHIERFPSPANPQAAYQIINRIVPVNLTLLGFTARFQLIKKMDEHELVAESCTKALEKLAGHLRIWIGGKDGETSGLDKEVKRSLVETCLGITKRIVGMEEDAGYESMSEEEICEGC